LGEAVTRKPSRTVPLEGGISARSVEQVILPDGSSYVRKDYGDADPISPKLHADGEELGALVLDAVGARTPAVARIDDHTVAMEFVEGRQGGVTGRLTAPREVIESADGRRIGLADALMGHQDRAGGNWIRTPDGHVVSIDNGGAFSGVGPDRAAAGNPFAAYILNQSGWASQIELSPDTDLVAVRGRLEALRPQFVAAGRGRWHEQVMGRLDKIERRAVPLSGAAPKAAPSTADATGSPAVAKMAGAKAPKPTFDAADVRTRLDAATSREEGHAALQGLTVAQLREVSPTSAAVSKNKAELVDNIVVLHVGGRLQFAEMMLSGGTPYVPGHSSSVAPSPAVAKMTRGRARETPAARASRLNGIGEQLMSGEDSEAR